MKIKDSCTYAFVKNETIYQKRKGGDMIPKTENGSQRDGPHQPNVKVTLEVDTKTIISVIFIVGVLLKVLFL